MKLNDFTTDPLRLKIAILSTPRTGNTWLRSLLGYAYSLPVVELPLIWRPESASALPERFVAHQHLTPSEDLFCWLVQNNVVVLTTIRHPGDTFLSYFHYLKWQETAADPGVADLLRDGDAPSKNAQWYVQHSFPHTYALSLTWARLGSTVVRYEDLLANPVAVLSALTARILPVDAERLRAAALLCQPVQMTSSGLADRRHLRIAGAGGWARELPSAVADRMRAIEPYNLACREYRYNWDPEAAPATRFDYLSIDPFGGRQYFDNGEPIGWALKRIYLYEIPNARDRWPEPTRTGGESFWNWLRSPHDLAASAPQFPAGTLTNLVMQVYGMRPDVQLAIAEPVGADRMRIVSWFIGQANLELEIPWSLVQPVVDAYSDYLKGIGPIAPEAAIRAQAG